MGQSITTPSSRMRGGDMLARDDGDDGNTNANHDYDYDNDYDNDDNINKKQQQQQYKLPLFGSRLNSMKDRLDLLSSSSSSKPLTPADYVHRQSQIRGLGCVDFN